VREELISIFLNAILEKPKVNKNFTPFAISFPIKVQNKI